MSLTVRLFGWRMTRRQACREGGRDSARQEGGDDGLMGGPFVCGCGSGWASRDTRRGREQTQRGPGLELKNRIDSTLDVAWPGPTRNRP